jgi:hypothetical protein
MDSSPGNDASSDAENGYSEQKLQLRSSRTSPNTAAATKPLVSPPLWTQDLQSLQIETHNLLRKCGTPSNLKFFRLTQRRSTKVEREKREQMNNNSVVGSSNSGSALLPRPPSADTIRFKGKVAAAKKNLLPRRSPQRLSISSTSSGSIFDCHGPTPPRKKYTDPQVYTETRKIFRSIEPNERENELYRLKQMDILRKLTSEEQSEEAMERICRRSLIKREEDAALKIQKTVRQRLALEKTAVLPATNPIGTPKESEIRSPYLTRSNNCTDNHSFCTKTGARLKKLSLKAADKISLKTDDCLPSIYTPSSLKKEMTQDQDNGRTHRKHSLQRRLFLEDGAPSDYLGTTILKICKRTRPKSASSKSEISQEEYDVLSTEDLSKDASMLPDLHDNGNRTISSNNGKLGHAYKLPNDVSLMQLSSQRHLSSPIFCNGSGKLSCDEELETTTQRYCPSSQNHQISDQRRGPVLSCTEENDLVHRLESDGVVFRKDGEPGPLCRRYRSEVFQEECVLKKQPFAFYETHRKRFRSVLRNSHPIYRMLVDEMNKCNLRHRARRHVKNWFRSLTESLLCKLEEGQHKNNAINLATTKVTMSNQRKLQLLSKNSHRIIDTEVTKVNLDELRLKPISLYQPREYLPSDARIVVLPDLCDVGPGTLSLGRDESKSEKMVNHEEFGRRIDTYASIRQRPAPNNMAIGGLSMEIIFSHFVNSDIALYGGYTCDEHALLLPEPSSIESNVQLCSIDIVPEAVSHRCTELGFDSPIDAYLPLPIIIYSGLDPNEKYYGLEKRPKLSTVKEFFGFRTSESSPSPVLSTNIKVCRALPSPDILAPNCPMVENPQTTHSDLNYPFCQPLGRVLTTKDYKHMLNRGEPSPNKTRTYSSLCSRKQGQFLSKCDTAAPLGRTASKIYCTLSPFEENPDHLLQKEAEGENFSNIGKSNPYKEGFDAAELPRGLRKEVKEGSIQPLLLSIVDNQAENCAEMKGNHGGTAGDFQVKDESFIEDETNKISLADVLNDSSEEVHLPTPLLQTDVIVDSITKALSGALKDFASTSDLIRVGVGLGMSLRAQGFFIPRSAENLHVSNIAEGSRVCLPSSLPSVAAKDDGVEAVISFDTKKEVFLTEPKVSRDLDTPKDSILVLPNRQSIDSNFCLSATVCPLGSNSNTRAIGHTETFLTAVSSTRVLKKSSSSQQKLPCSHHCKPIGKLNPIQMGDEWIFSGYNPWCSQDFLPMIEFETSLIDHDAAVSDPEAMEAKMAKEFADVINLVKQGRYDEVEEKLSSHDWLLPVDYENAEGNTIFIISCQHGSKRLAKLLLKKGSSLNKQNINGHTCLHYAFGYGFGEYISGSNQELLRGTLLMSKCLLFAIAVSR